MADAFPMLARCMQKQPMAEISRHPEPLAPSHEELHRIHGAEGDILVSSCVEDGETPNLLLWTGSMHCLVLTLKDDDDDPPFDDPRPGRLICRTVCR